VAWMPVPDMKVGYTRYRVSGDIKPMWWTPNQDAWLQIPVMSGR
jgi:hypothetical protein